MSSVLSSVGILLLLLLTATPFSSEAHGLVASDDSLKIFDRPKIIRLADAPSPALTKPPKEPAALEPTTKATLTVKGRLQCHGKLYWYARIVLWNASTNLVLPLFNFTKKKHFLEQN